MLKGISLKPFSVIDGRKYSLTRAFSWILDYFDPNKESPEKSKILDVTCSDMVMWNKEDWRKFNVFTNDIDKKVKAKYHYDCSRLHEHLDQKFDMIIYDPPYIDLKNREDKKKYEKIFKYSKMKSIDDLGKLTISSSFAFNSLLQKDGILICKITNFHLDGRLRGSYDIIRWFSNNFHLKDEIIFRFYRSISNMNFYKLKAIITHSYFLIFKKIK